MFIGNNLNVFQKLEMHKILSMDLQTNGHEKDQVKTLIQILRHQQAKNSSVT